MRMYNGNFPQWMGRLSYLVSTIATKELAMGVRGHQQPRNLPISPDLFQSQQQTSFQRFFFFHFQGECNAFCTETDVRR